jgi:hypothetical protein
MSSPKFIFYLTQNNNILSFDKNIMIDVNNKIKWNEIHITQFIIHKEYKDDIRNISLSIDNFNENIDMSNESNNYTIKLVDVNNQYFYNNLHSSKITNNIDFIENNNKIHFKLDIMINNNPINDYFFLDSDDESNEVTLFEIELFFK